MEPAKIDWKNIDSKFVEDKLYEHINAPKWFDFLASYEHSVDDDAWFCRPDCNHPKTAQDFLRSTPSKLSSTNDVSEIPPLGDRTQREAKLKRRGLLTHTWVSPNSNLKFNESSENQNPNLSTPPPPNYNHVKTMKTAIKSSTEKKEPIDDASQNNEALPMLKNTLSARNLLMGRDILNQITEFCNELKRLATRSKERENVVRLNVRKSFEEGVKEEVKKEEIKGEVLGELNWRDRERKPFLEINHEKSQGIDKSSVKKRLINKNDNAENIPISVNLEYVKRKGEETLLQIRTNPPSPQCFSATRVPAGKTTPSKVSKSKLMEREILQEQNKKTMEDYYKDKGKSLPMVDGREARTLDVFWFLKPCTLST